MYGNSRPVAEQRMDRKIAHFLANEPWAMGCVPTFVIKPPIIYDPPHIGQVIRTMHMGDSEMALLVVNDKCFS